MPNWSYNTITFLPKEDNDKCNKAFKKFKEKFMEYYEDTTKEYGGSDFGHNWLGDYLVHFGYITVEELEVMGKRSQYENGYNIRGCVEEAQDSEHDLIVYTRSAWTPSIKMWDYIIKKKYSDKDKPLINIIFTAEEEGDDFYYCNDFDNILYDKSYRILLLLNANKLTFDDPYDFICHHDVVASDNIQYIEVGNVIIDCHKVCDYNEENEICDITCATIDVFDNIFYTETELVNIINNEILYGETIKSLKEFKEKYITNNDKVLYSEIKETEFVDIDDPCIK